MKPIFKRVLSGILSTITAVNAVPFVSANAEESAELYPYTMFAASDTEGAITVNANNLSINGYVATNGTIASSENLNINGTITEDADEEMFNFLNKLNSTYFIGENVTAYTQDHVIYDLNVNINDPITVDGSMGFAGNINLNSDVKVLYDININNGTLNSNNAIICSELGDITIEATSVNFNGLIYAPYGDIVINWTIVNKVDRKNKAVV